MTDTKPTPGPWQVGRKDDDGFGANILIVAPANNEFVASVLDLGPERRSEQAANAHLIVAAQELLRALEHAVRIAEGEESGNWDDVMKYRALVFKAKGEV